MKNDSIKTYNCKKDFGNFRLKRKSGPNSGFTK